MKFAELITDTIKCRCGEFDYNNLKIYKDKPIVSMASIRYIIQIQLAARYKQHSDRRSFCIKFHQDRFKTKRRIKTLRLRD